LAALGPSDVIAPSSEIGAWRAINNTAGFDVAADSNGSPQFSRDQTGSRDKQFGSDEFGQTDGAFPEERVSGHEGSFFAVAPVGIKRRSRDEQSGANEYCQTNGASRHERFSGQEGVCVKPG
jgi:hypothetical protein